MNNVIILEEIFLNCLPTTSRTFCNKFILNYSGLTPLENSVQSIYSYDTKNPKEAIQMVNCLLTSSNKTPLYRIINANEYSTIDRTLFSLNFDKILPFMVLKADLLDKKESLFRYASFYENGIFIDQNINLDSKKWLDDYFYLNNMNIQEKNTFLDMLSIQEVKNYGFNLVQEGTLVGSAFCARQGNIMVLQNLVISEKYRHLGYSTKLLGSVLTLALREGCTHLITQIPILKQGQGKLFSKDYFDFVYSGYYRAKI